MKVIQIKGSNGTGKTTIVKQLLDVADKIDGYPSYPAQFYVDAKMMVYATYLDSIKWAVIGEYPIGGRMGGCDTFPHPGTMEYIKMSLQTVIETTPNYYGVIFEGMMISTIKSTFYEYLLNYPGKQKINPLFIILNSNLEGCTRRILARGSNPDLKFDHDNVKRKCDTVLRHALGYDQHYVAYMNVDNIRLESMLPTFLDLVGDTDLLNLMRKQGWYGQPDCIHSQRHL